MIDDGETPESHSRGRDGFRPDFPGHHICFHM